MSVQILLSKTSLEAAVTATAVSIATALVADSPGKSLYQLVCNTNCWWAQGIADTVFTAANATEIFTVTAGHKLFTGDAVVVSNSGGALPTGLSAATVYWASVLTTTTFKLYDTRAHALAGGVTGLISISDDGSGTNTATTTASAAAGSAFLPANIPITIDGVLGAKVSVIRDTADGKASIAQILTVR